MIWLSKVVPEYLENFAWVPHDRGLQYWFHDRELAAINGIEYFRNEDIGGLILTDFGGQLRKIFNVQLEIFRPMWRRVVIVALCFAWALFEVFYTGSLNWALIVGAVGTYLFHQFFIAFDPGAENESSGE